MSTYESKYILKELDIFAIKNQNQHKGQTSTQEVPTGNKAKLRCHNVTEAAKEMSTVPSLQLSPHGSSK